MLCKPVSECEGIELKRKTIAFFTFVTVLYSLSILYSPVVAASDVLVVSHSYYEQFGYSYIVGEIQNIGSDNIENVIITVTFFDGNDTVTGNGFGYSKIHALVPGQKSPFEISSIPYYNLDVDHYEVVIDDYFVTSFKPYREFFLNNVSTEIVEGEFFIHGEVLNQGPITTTWVRVIATYYDSQGTVIGTDVSNLNPGVIESTQSAPFTTDTFPRIFTPDNYYLQVECRESALTPSSLSISVSQSSILPDESIQVSGSLDPEIPNATIRLRYSRPDGSTFSRYVTTLSSGNYAHSYTPNMVGRWSVIAIWEGNSNYTDSSSKTRIFVVLSKIPSSIFFGRSSDEIISGEEMTVSGFLTPQMIEANITINMIKPDGSTLDIDRTIDPGGAFEYTFSPLEAGIWVVKVSWLGDETYSGSTSDSIIFRVLEAVYLTGNLSVVVRDQEGVPVGGVSVMSFSQPIGQQSLNGITDVDGSLVFSDIYAGEYVFQMSKTGYETVSELVTVVEGVTTALAIPFGGLYGDLSVVVRDQEGVPVGGVSVMSVSQPIGQQSLNGTTDVDGSLAFSDIYAGEYVFQVSKEDYAVREEPVMIHPGGISELYLNIERMVQFGNIKMVVQDENANLLRDVLVISTLQLSDEDPLNGTTNSEGFVIFSNINVGNYVLQVSGKGYKKASLDVTVVNGITTNESIILQKENSLIVPATIFISLIVVLAVSIIKKDSIISIISRLRS